MKEFKGRVIAKGAFIGEAKVTHEGFNCSITNNNEE